MQWNVKNENSCFTKKISNPIHKMANGCRRMPQSAAFSRSGFQNGEVNRFCKKRVHYEQVIVNLIKWIKKRVAFGDRVCYDRHNKEICALYKNKSHYKGIYALQRKKRQKNWKESFPALSEACKKAAKCGQVLAMFENNDANNEKDR